VSGEKRLLFLKGSRGGGMCELGEVEGLVLFGEESREWNV